MKISPIMSPILQSQLSILPKKKWTVKNLPKLVNFCQSGEISPNLVTLPVLSLFYHKFVNFFQSSTWRWSRAAWTTCLTGLLEIFPTTRSCPFRPRTGSWREKTTLSVTTLTTSRCRCTSRRGPSTGTWGTGWQRLSAQCCRNSSAGRTLLAGSDNTLKELLPRMSFSCEFKLCLKCFHWS